jgi:hypothetical protein
MERLDTLVPPTTRFDDETQDAVFEAIDRVDGELEALNKAIHGAYQARTAVLYKRNVPSFRLLDVNSSSTVGADLQTTRSWRFTKSE